MVSAKCDIISVSVLNVILQVLNYVAVIQICPKRQVNSNHQPDRPAKY